MRYRFFLFFFFFSSRRRHTRCLSDWSSDVCSSDLNRRAIPEGVSARKSPLRLSRLGQQGGRVSARCFRSVAAVSWNPRRRTRRARPLQHRPAGTLRRQFGPAGADGRVDALRAGVREGRAAVGERCTCGARQWRDKPHGHRNGVQGVQHHCRRDQGPIARMAPRRDADALAHPRLRRRPQQGAGDSQVGDREVHHAGATRGCGGRPTHHDAALGLPDLRSRRHRKGHVLLQSEGRKGEAAGGAAEQGNGDRLRHRWHQRRSQQGDGCRIDGHDQSARREAAARSTRCLRFGQRGHGLPYRAANRQRSRRSLPDAEEPVAGAGAQAMIDGRDLQRTSTYGQRNTMNKIIVAALVALIAVTSAAAQDYPSHPIKFMHGFPPGGNVDIIGRLLGNEMSKGLGQSIVIEPKPGVAGSLAAEAVARSEPDGYTLLVVPSAHPAHGALARNVNYKVVEDFEWISVASFYPFLICVRKDSPFQTLTQLIDEARKNPGVLKYGSAGVGSILHTTVELIGNETKTKFLHIPYRGEAPAMTGLLQGDIDFIAATSGPISARIRSGEFRALAVTGKTRWRDFPDVPTVAEEAIPGFEVISWTGLAGPAKLPTPIVDKLNAEVRRAVSVPDVKDKLESMGGDPRATTPAEMRALVASQFATWRRLAKEANISID